MLDLAGEVEALWPELLPVIEKTLKSARFIMGPEVVEFEREIGELLGLDHSIAVNSGSDALTIALQAMGVGPGDEVITTPFTFVATGSCVLRLGATPVFCDIESDTLNLDPRAVREAITPRTRAVIPVHLFGHAAKLDAIMTIAKECDLLVLEDVAQAISGRYNGQRLGSIGDAAAFSFFPSKNLGAYGDGGLIAARDKEVADRAAMLRVHGARQKYFNEVLGYNSRLDALQAAILRVKLRHLDDWTTQRREAAARYAELLEGTGGVVLPTSRAGVEHTFHQYTIRVPAERRDDVQRHLKEAGIASMIYYPVLLTKLPLFADYEAEVPIAQRACSEVLSLPIWPGISQTTQERVAAELKRALD